MSKSTHQPIREDKKKVVKLIEAIAKRLARRKAATIEQTLALVKRSS